MAALSSGGIIVHVMKIAVGTTSEQKLQYLQEVLRELNFNAELIPVDVVSGVSVQPISDLETKFGSSNRARNAFHKANDADFAIGIEVGYHPKPNGDYRIFCWATIVDNSGKQISARSHQLLLPQFHQSILKQDKNLGDYVQQYITENPDPISTEIGTIIRFRKPFIQTSLQAVLFEYFFD